MPIWAKIIFRILTLGLSYLVELNQLKKENSNAQKKTS